MSRCRAIASLGTAEPDRRLAALRFTFPVDLLITNCQRREKSWTSVNATGRISLTIRPGGIQGYSPRVHPSVGQL
jgi:hypothetical protein